MKKQLFIIGIGTLNILHAGFHLLQFVQSALLVSNSLDHNHGFEGILHNPYFAVVWAVVGIVTLWIGIKDFKHHKEMDDLCKILDGMNKSPIFLKKEKIPLLIQAEYNAGYMDYERYPDTYHEALVKEIGKELLKNNLIKIEKIDVPPTYFGSEILKLKGSIYVVDTRENEPRPPKIRNLNHWQ